MYCQNCGKQNQDEAKFCFNCGNTIFSDLSITSVSNVSEIKITPSVDILYAGFLKRLFAFILDAGVLFLLLFLLGIVLSSSDENPQRVTNIFSFFITWLYFSLMESSKKISYRNQSG